MAECEEHRLERHVASRALGTELAAAEMERADSAVVCQRQLALAVRSLAAAQRSQQGCLDARASQRMAEAAANASASQSDRLERANERLRRDIAEARAEATASAKRADDAVRLIAELGRDRTCRDEKLESTARELAAVTMTVSGQADEMRNAIAERKAAQDLLRHTAEAAKREAAAYEAAREEASERHARAIQEAERALQAQLAGVVETAAGDAARLRTEHAEALEQSKREHAVALQRSEGDHALVERLSATPRARRRRPCKWSQCSSLSLSYEEEEKEFEPLIALRIASLFFYASRRMAVRLQDSNSSSSS